MGLFQPLNCLGGSGQNNKGGGGGEKNYQGTVAVCLSYFAKWHLKLKKGLKSVCVCV